MRHYRDGELVVIKDEYHRLIFRNEKAIVMSSKQVFKDENSYRDYKVFAFKVGLTTLVSGYHLEALVDEY